jgi:hypothetical protein
MSREPIEGTVRAARDSVWVVNDELQKLSNGGSWTEQRKGNIERNVAHLELVMSNPEISGSGLDLSDLTAAINSGKAELANH